VSGSVAVVSGGLVALAAVSVVANRLFVDVLLIAVAAIAVAACLARFDALSVRSAAPAAE
ncbi:MAG: hypothetical protein ACJ8H8_28290, partial [Geminicoccaceae bacterium]